MILYVVGFMFDERGNEVLLIEKAKPKWQAGKLNGVGGKIEKTDESPEHAMAREFKEETGIDHDHIYWDLRVIYQGPDYEIYFFYTEGCPTLARQQPNEIEKPVVVPNWRELPENAIYNLRWIVPMMRDGNLQFPIRVNDYVAEAAHSGTESKK
jgi:8-oxo-dGTP diphosphatase